MTDAQARPTGVTILAVIALIAGVTHIAAGLGDIGIGGGFLSDVGFGERLDAVMQVVGLILIAVGVVGVVTAFGLFSERNWAWLIARLWASVCVVVGVIAAALSFLGDTVTSNIAATIVGSFVPAVAAAVVLWYLYRPNVRAAFGRA